MVFNGLPSGAYQVAAYEIRNGHSSLNRTAVKLLFRTGPEEAGTGPRTGPVPQTAPG